MKIGRKIAGCLRRFDHAEHGAANNDKLAARGACGLSDGAKARDVGGECGDRHAFWCFPDQACELDRNIGLRWGNAVADCIG